MNPQTKHAQYADLPFQSIKIRDEFWNKYIDLMTKVSIPYQWDVLNDRVPGIEPSHAIANFEIVAKRKQGDFWGRPFQDSDLYKWLEGSAYSLLIYPDKELEEKIDWSADLIEAAQQPDGYINTYYCIRNPEGRWKNLLEGHELYCAGHLIEAAAAYKMVTGKENLLKIACRFADLICSIFGPGENQIHGYPGHQEIELALVKLYHVTDCTKYLDLAYHFLNIRGRKPNYFDTELEKYKQPQVFEVTRKYPRSYSQAHIPPAEQTEAVGHSVRALYMYTGMADVASLKDDEALAEACLKLWDNIETRQLYVTGSIGASAYGESFTFDYDLPNDLAYSETCASIALMMFANRMLHRKLDGRFGDVMERVLHNTLLGSISKDGKHFFYVNPLEADVRKSDRIDAFKHVKVVRQPWFACACCPPNAVRTILNLGSYAYGQSENGLYIHQYIGGSIDIQLAGQPVGVDIDSRYLEDGSVTVALRCGKPVEFELGFRVPGWAGQFELRLNNKTVASKNDAKNGYLLLKRKFQDGDTLHISIPLEVRKIHANPKVYDDIGKIAFQRGPFIYCIEEADNGEDLHLWRVNDNAAIEGIFDISLLGGCMTLHTEAERAKSWNGTLYEYSKPIEYEMKKMKMIPYYLWANRGPNEMRVWIREKDC